MPLYTFAAAIKHGVAAPRSQREVFVLAVGVSGEMTANDTGSKGRELTASVLDDTNFAEASAAHEFCSSNSMPHGELALLQS